ncbi:MAG: hypothetical protein VX589_19000 [Myxococcota bacterium]|nr:hypothetical protein [Myxococcota bacterium]
MKRTQVARRQGEPDTARVVGRGLFVITGAKVWFMLGGAAITFGLPFIFDRYHASGRALYGQYYDLNNILSIFSMVMVTGVMQSVSRFVAPTPHAAKGIVQQALRVISVAGALLGGGLILLSPTIAITRGNPDLVHGYRAAGCIVFAYGIYTVMVGCLNGQKRFVTQALLDITFTTLKVALVLGMAVVGLGVLGAFAGFAMAATIIAIVAIGFIYPKLNGGSASGGYTRYALQVMMYAFVFNLIFKLDGVFVKPVVYSVLHSPELGSIISGLDHLWPSRWPMWVEDVLQHQTDEKMANYGMALALARLPWQGTIAVTFVMFPLMSAASFAENQTAATTYIRQTLRYSTVIIGLAVALLVALPESIFALLPAGYESGARIILLLGPAYFFFSLFNLANTLLIASGRAAVALAIGTLTVALVSLAYWVYLPSASSAHAVLLRAAQVNLVMFAFGLALGLGALWRTYGPPFPLGTAARIGIAMSVVIIIGRISPSLAPIQGALAAIGLTGVFVLLLVATGEFDQTDRARLFALFGRRK